MMLDRLENAAQYVAIDRRLKAGMDFLQNLDPTTLTPGRVECDGDRLFALVARDMGRGKEQAVLECHRRYWDIQYVVEGRDLIGWSSLDACKHVSAPYDEVRDIEFYADRPQFWLSLSAGTFAVFFPQDVHAPLAAHGPVLKIVVKILAEA